MPESEEPDPELVLVLDPEPELELEPDPEDPLPEDVSVEGFDGAGSLTFTVMDAEESTCLESVARTVIVAVPADTPWMESAPPL